MGMSCCEFHVATGNDDGHERVNDGNMALGQATIRIGDNRILGARFQNVGIPQGAQIIQAHLRIYVKERPTRTVSVIYEAEDIDDSPVFTTTPYDFSNRTMTTAKVAITLPDWTLNTWEDGPDIKGLVQEVVSRAGWTSGNAMSIFIRDDGSTDYRAVAAYENTSPPDTSAILCVSYLVPDSKKSRAWLVTQD